MCWECDHPDSTPLDYLGHMREPIPCYGWAVQGRCSGQYGVTRRMTPDSAAADGMAETRGRAGEAGMHRQARGSGGHGFKIRQLTDVFHCNLQHHLS